MAEPANPAGWPEDLLQVFERFLVCEYASLTARGTPVTYPITPYVGEDRRTLDVSCGLTSPAKAERARRNREVALLYSEPLGSGLPDPATVLVQGHATVSDRDLQANTDRYVRLQLAKYPDPWKGVPKAVIRGQDWYWARIWIRVTPLTIRWWPGGRLDRPAEEWRAPAGTEAPPSDPKPAGAQPPAWREPATAWRERLLSALERIGRPVLTVVDQSGGPVPFRVGTGGLEGDALRLELPAGRPVNPPGGPACLTFHRHDARMRGYENAVFVGTVDASGDDVVFIAERALPDISLMGSKWKMTRDFFSSRRLVKPRVAAEAARRGQPPPKVRLPGDR